MKLERGLSRNTVEAYARDLAKFRDHCARTGVEEAGRVESADVLRFLVWLAEGRIGVRSQARNLVALRGLFRHLRAERHITLDRAMWGTDQAASIEPGRLVRLVRDIRVIESAMGDGVKRVYDSERASIEKLRRPT